MRRERSKNTALKQSKDQGTKNAYNDMMGAPLDVAQHPTNSLPAPAGGDYRGVTAPFNAVTEPFSDTQDPFNIGA